YVAAAEHLLATGSYPERTGFYFVRPPGYPAFLAVATLGHPGVVWLAKCLNALLGAAACVLIARLSTRIFRRPNLSVATGLAAALHPALLRISSDVQSEPLFLLLLLFFAFFLLAAADRPSGNLALLSGAALGLAALTRPTGLCLAPLLLAPLFDRRWPTRIRAQISAAAFVGLFAALGPWTLRNALVYRELVLVNDGFGLNFYAGNSDWAFRAVGQPDRQEVERLTVEFDQDVRARLASLDAAGVRSPGARSRAFFDAALEQRRGDLAGWARLMGRKAIDWIRPWPNPGYWPRTVVLFVGGLSLVLYLGTISGLLVSRRRGVAAFAAAALLISMAAHVAILVSWRYRIPFWEPILLIYGMAGAARILGGKKAFEPL
ncbi:MAG TPA: glycosyltransferase family 39 protein, partial [Thermoanaerobaculia bacterium]